MNGKLSLATIVTLGISLQILAAGSAYGTEKPNVVQEQGAIATVTQEISRGKEYTPPNNGKPDNSDGSGSR